MTRVITSVDNARVKAARALSRPKRRRETGLCLLEGARAIETALEAGAVVRDVFAAPAARTGQRGRALLERLAQAGAAVFDVTERVLQSISATETPQGIVATAVIPAAGPEEFAGVAAVLVADRIGDPGNLGTMARTAAAVGAGLWTTFGSADLFDPKALRASAGTAFLLPVRQRMSVDEVAAESRRTGRRLVAADADGPLRYDQFGWDAPFALVIGSEAHGVDPRLLEAADAVVRLPLAPGVESLNAAVTAAVCLFEAARRRWPGGAAKPFTNL